MAVTQQQLLTALKNWCIDFCYHGVTKNNAINYLNQFCAGNFVPQEEQIDAGAATHFQNHHYSALYSLKGRLEAIGLETDLSVANRDATKHHNVAECAGWAQLRGHQIEELHGLLTDLSNWAGNYRGSKAILNVLKLVRALSR